jgi:hypothetical protein
MTTEVVHTYSFNRPVTAFFLVPLLFLVVLFTYVLIHQFNALALLMIVLSLLMIFSLVYFSFFRTLKIGGGKAVWRTPFKRYEFELSELKHYGIIKFRRFRFAYLSKATSSPFEDATVPVVASPETFLIQFRPSAWALIESVAQMHHPELKPGSIVRQ